MAFFINDRLGEAYEDVEGGVARWDFLSQDFTTLLSLEEMRSKRPIVGSRSCSADEAKDFMRAKTAAAAGQNKQCD